MAIDLVAIRGAIADQLRDGLSREVRVYDGYIPSSPTPPCVLIEPDRDQYVDYYGTFGAARVVTVRYRITVAMPPGPDTDGQRVLDEFLSTGSGQDNSVIDAITADQTFGDAVDACVVRGVEYLGRIYLSENVDQQVQADAAAITLEVHTQRA